MVLTAIEQRGFRLKEGSAIHLHTLKALVNDNIENRKDLSYIFLDVAKAFGSVNHEAMLGALSAPSLPSQMVKLVACLYRGNTTAIKGLINHRPLKIKEASCKAILSHHCSSWRRFRKPKLLDTRHIGYHTY